MKSEKTEFNGAMPDPLPVAHRKLQIEYGQGVASQVQRLTRDIDVLVTRALRSDPLIVQHEKRNKVK